MIALILVLFVHGILSWWCTGHMLVAQVALMQLNTTYSDMANGIIGHLNGIEFTKSPSFVSSACFADDLKTMNVHEYDNWHFINLIWTNGTNYSTPTPSSDNIVTELGRIMETLKSSDNGIWSKSFLFRFLIHLVGDIHQPLHCAGLRNSFFPSPEGDVGGNLFAIQYKSYSELHALWDSGIDMYGMDFNRPLTKDSIHNITEMAKIIIQEFPKEHFNGSDHNLNFTSWSLNSFQLAKDYAYYHLHNGSVITDEYINRSRKIVNQQIALGGYRLANLIQQMPIVQVRNDFSTVALIGVAVGLFFLGVIGGVCLAQIIKSREQNQQALYQKING